MMKLRNFLLVIFSAFLGAILALGISHFILPKETQTLSDRDKTPALQTSYQAHPNQTIDFTFASNVATQSVVHVNTLTKGSNLSQNQIPRNNLLEHFFGQTNPAQPKESRGSGSGVVISENGYIVTNNHVIENSDEIEITLNNNRTYPAKLIGADKDTDLALLKIDEKDLPYLEFANSDSAQVGEWVLAVGNPFNLASTVTAGIVSAKGRNINLLENIQGSGNTAIESFIQTDAAINPGNSGGALVNTNGEVIGINTAIATPTGTYAGYAFAVPSNIAQKVVNDLMEFGKVQRAFIGVNILSVDNNIAEQLNLSSPNGVYIQNVMPDGAADEAGLIAEDVIVGIEGIQISDVAGLQEKIASYRPGNVIKVSFLRKNKLLHATLSLKNKFNNQELLKENSNRFLNYGIEVKELSQMALESFNLKSGIEVAEIHNNGFIKMQTSMKEGFVITKLDNEIVNSVENLIRLMNEKKGKILIEGVYKNDDNAYLYSVNIE